MGATLLEDLSIVTIDIPLIIREIMGVFAVMLLVVGNSNGEELVNVNFPGHPINQRARARHVALWIGLVLAISPLLSLGVQTYNFGYSLLFPRHLLIPANTEKFESTWKVLQDQYHSDVPGDRNALVSAVGDLASYGVSDLTPEQRRQFDLAVQFAVGWKESTRAEWDEILSQHPADALTPLARYERERIPAPAPPEVPIPKPEVAAPTPTPKEIVPAPSPESVTSTDGLSLEDLKKHGYYTKIYFDRAATVPSDEAVAQWAQLLLNHPNLRFRIDAYTDSAEGMTQDTVIGQVRLDAVQDKLQKMGVDFDVRKVREVDHGGDYPKTNPCATGLDDGNPDSCVSIDLD